MSSHNNPRLFAASCIALVLTAMTFAIRARLETVFGPVGVGLTLEQIGYAFAPAFWGFTLAMIIGGPIVDYFGMRNGMKLAFALHLAGIVIGAIGGYFLMDVVGLSWQVMVASLFIPLAAYGYLFAGQSFPLTERVEMGVSTPDALRGLITPLYLLVGFYMLISAATEFVTTQRIESMLAATGVNGLLLLAYINGIMILGRAYAGRIVKVMSTAGMLWFSAIVSFIGLQMLAQSTEWLVFVSAAVFAVGITLFWPTTLALIAESLPQTGAFGLAIMGGGWVSCPLRSCFPSWAEFLTTRKAWKRFRQSARCRPF